MNMRLGGNLGSAFDMTAIVAFIAFAVIYFLVPVVGYHPQRPAALTASLYILIAYGGLSVVHALLMWVQLFEQPQGFRGGGRLDSGAQVFFMIAGLKMIVFVAALFAFVSGLRGLYRQPWQPGRPSPADERDSERFRRREE